MNSFIFFGFQDWKTGFLYFYIIPIAILLLSTIFVLQKTPIDLLKSENPEEILLILRRIGKMNNVDNAELTIGYISDLQMQYRH